jgi:hypothetical protein
MRQARASERSLPARASAACRGRGAFKEAALTLLVALLLGYSSMFSGVSLPNERSRAYLSVAIVDHGTLAIDEPVRRFGAILDVSRFGRHLYSDKAPGSSLLGAGAYGAMRLLSPAEQWPIHRVLTLMRLSIMLPLSLVGFWAVRRLLRQLSFDRGVVDLASLGWMLGTAAFHYSVAFYGHQIAAVCLLVGLLLVSRAERATASGPPAPAAAVVNAAGAGACAGLAGLTEYQAGIASLLLALYVAVGPLRRDLRALLGFVAGALPFVVLLGGYNTLAFGGPFELSYHHLAHAAWQKIHTQGIGGITWPHRDAFVGGLLSLHRGLLATSPVFFLCLPGAWHLWHRGRKRLAVLLAAGCLYYALLISSSNMWVAGWAYGPRLLVAAMGWGTLLVAGGLEWLGRWRVGEVVGRASIAVGILLAQSVHAFFPEPPPEATNPWVDVVAALYRHDLVAPNILSRSTGLHGVSSLVPLIGLLLVVLAIVLFEPLTRRRQRGETAALGLGSALLAAAAVWGTASRGPGWTRAQERWFVGFVRDLDTQERHVPK